MTNPKKIARIAGFLYLIVVLSGIFSLMYVPTKIIVWENANSTFTNVIENETLFRLGLLGYMIAIQLFLFCLLFYINY